jgi:hypothetical protein
MILNGGGGAIVSYQLKKGHHLFKTKTLLEYKILFL